MNKIQKSHTYDILFCISKLQNVELSINDLINFETKVVKIVRLFLKKESLASIRKDINQSVY